MCERLGGRIVRAIAGFYFVSTDIGEIRCHARGSFKKRGQKPCVGDFVEISLTGDEGIVETLLPRRNELRRPHIANVDHVLVVCSLVSPAFAAYALDKLLAVVTREGLAAAIVFTKADLPGAAEVWEEVSRIYVSLPYAIVKISSDADDAIAHLGPLLKGRVTVLAGASGVGKSTLLQRLAPESNAVSGPVSSKLERGRQTTTAVSLHPCAGGFVADSPGFSQLDVGHIPADELDACFPDLWCFAVQCDFRGCMHESEVGCRVRVAVVRGEIAASRYHSYLGLVKEIREAEARRY
ncbi:MAG: ribosome small subunit-dependent GTPase A [Firmicutes bacterium]|nr:ribosome small subunit-dependent GTPase A [Bacillota bacterium]